MQAIQATPTAYGAAIPATVRPKDGAAILGIGVSTFWRWHKEMPDFPKGRRLSTRCTVFDASELLAWRDKPRTVEVAA